MSLLSGKLIRDPLKSSGSVVHHSAVAFEREEHRREPGGDQRSRGGHRWTFASTAPSSLRRVPLIRPTERLAATYAA